MSTLHHDDDGYCLPFRPPHRFRIGVCSGCNNHTPSGKSWDEYESSLSARVTLIRLDEKRQKINDLTYALVESRAQLASSQ